jgi:hypothetical protein
MGVPSSNKREGIFQPGAKPHDPMIELEGNLGRVLIPS